MKILCVSRELHPRHPFRISRARRNEVRNVFLHLESDGVAGVGEASPNAFYGETWQGVMAKLEGASEFIRALAVRSVADVEKAWSDAWAALAPSRAAQCALDLALWDWLGKREGVSVAELLWATKPRPVSTFCTVGLSSPEELAGKLGELSEFPQIKVKSDQSADLAPARFIREGSSASIAVDANCAWGGVDLSPLTRELAALGVIFIEQPFAPEEDARVRESGSCLPVFADESCATLDDVPRIAAHFAGFNIKLVKCGGITPARRMVRHGRELGCQLMTGCMLESSALIAAGAAIAQQTHFADLDGAWLLGDDPYRGWNFERGVLTPPDASGLGVAATSSSP